MDLNILRKKEKKLVMKMLEWTPMVYQGVKTQVRDDHLNFPHTMFPSVCRPHPAAIWLQSMAERSDHVQSWHLQHLLGFCWASLESFRPYIFPSQSFWLLFTTIVLNPYDWLIVTSNPEKISNCGDDPMWPMPRVSWKPPRCGRKQVKFLQMTWSNWNQFGTKSYGSRFTPP